MNSVGPGRTPTSTAALKKEFGTPAAWAEQETRRLRQAGFNGAGAWSDAPLLRTAKEPLVYTPEGAAAVPGKNPKGGFMRSFGNAKKLAKQGSGHAMYPNDCMPVFHPEFPAFCDAHAKPLAALKDDPWLLGYFSDNDPSNRDSNKGVVTIRYEPYAPLLDLMRELNRNVYPLAAYFGGVKTAQ